MHFTALLVSIALSVTSVVAFSYHDNYVVMAWQPPSAAYTFVQGSYTLTEVKVTSGQDPDRQVQPGQIRTWKQGGGMTFRVGRKGTADVASWWSARIPAAQSTFGNNPGKLNFAFLGTLTVILSGGNLGAGVTDLDTFTVQNFGLAQGHTLGANNWWAGGKNCARAVGDTVRCAATRNNGELWHLTFKRGGDQNYDQVNWVALVDIESF